MNDGEFKMMCDWLDGNPYAKITLDTSWAKPYEPDLKTPHRSCSESKPILELKAIQNAIAYVNRISTQSLDDTIYLIDGCIEYLHNVRNKVESEKKRRRADDKN